MRYILLVSFCFVASQLLGQEEIAPSFFEGSFTYQVKFNGQQAEMLKQNEPNTNMTIHIREGDYITLLKGGRYPKTFMFLADSNREYSIDFSRKLAFRYSRYSDRIRKEKSRPNASPTGQKGTVYNLECDIYKVRTEDTQFLYFVHDDYRVDVSDYPRKLRARPFFLVPGLEGRIPLKVVKKQKALTVIQEVKKITPTTFNPKQFLIPPAFIVKNRDYRY